MNKYYYISLFLILCITACSEQKGFDLISSSQSNITFNNNIIENDSFNILDFEYLYNGGGVGIGDFNNDGLEDIYFTGNMESNALYLNKSNFSFEDITEKAGVALQDKWSSGVAVIDINNDGWKDIYVCNTTYENTQRRKNSLLINQGLNAEGIPSFIDMAEAYGLDDDSFSINAAFFDYDNDEDLDVIIIINEMQDTRYPSLYRRNKKRKTNYQRIDRLLENNFDNTKGHPVFTDVSEQAGIKVPGFSLGVNITDINNDGWKDIYISNDFISNDVLYINQLNGTFKDESKKYLKHTSHSAMGNDVIDINNDALPDIVALDMLPEGNYRQKTMLGPINYSYYINNDKYGFTYQSARNTLQLNAGFDEHNNLNKFSDISLMSGMHATDWSWTPLIADFDQDAFRDIIITNGFPKDVTDRDYIDYHADTYAYASQEMMLSKIPSVKIKNYAYRNNGALQFEDVSTAWGIETPSYSNGAAYADFDNDGDLDYVVNNIKDEVHLYKNDLVKKGNRLSLKLEGSKNNIDAFGSIITLSLSDQQIIHYEHSPFRGYLSTQTDIIHFGLGNRDTISQLEITWPDGKKSIKRNIEANQLLALSHKNAKTINNQNSNTSEDKALFQSSEDLISYKHSEDDFIDYNIQPLLPYKLSQLGPGISVADINSDGLDDFYISGPAFRQGSFFIQNADGSFKRDSFINSNPDIEEMAVLFFDAEGDGDKDMFVSAGSYEFEPSNPANEDRFYENINGQFYYKPDVLPTENSACLALKATDFDKDGDIDLFIGGRSIHDGFPKGPKSYLLENISKDGKTKFIKLEEETINLNTIGMVSDAIWTDFNNDEWMDLILVGEFSAIHFYMNREGKFEKIENSGVENIKGFWNSICSVDIDLDGDQDYIVGNMGSNVLHEINAEHPYRIYVNDFDKNGSVDMLPFSYQLNKEGTKSEFPVATREDFAKEINAIKKMYQTFDAYASVDRNILITDTTLKRTEIFEVNETRTSLLINEGNNKFSIKALPIEAQLAPVFASIADDFDGDNNPDILLTGNNFSNELIVGRMDALNGLFLKGDGKGTFKSLPIAESGIYIPGDGKSLARLIRANGDEMILSGVNNSALQSFTKSTDNMLINLNDDDSFVVYDLSQRTLRKELYLGSSYLSQNSTTISLPKEAENIVIINSRGERRALNSVIE